MLGHLFEIEPNSNVSIIAGRPLRLRHLRRAELSTDEATLVMIVAMKHSSKLLQQYYAAPSQSVRIRQAASCSLQGMHGLLSLTVSVAVSHDVWMAILRPVMPLQMQRLC